MNIQNRLKDIFNTFAGMSEDAFNLSNGFWHVKKFKKGDMFNDHKSVCKELGFIVEGTFRSYISDPDSGEERNVFFYSKNSFMTAYKSFVNQIPCEYYTEALTDAQLLSINIFDLKKLYAKSHEWETFGRLVAEMAATIGIDRVESFLLKSPEQRYIELMDAHPNLIENVPLYHISSYLGIQGPSLSRIRRRLADRERF